MGHQFEFPLAIDDLEPEGSVIVLAGKTVKRCGKSTMLDVLGGLVYRPLVNAGRVTAAPLFRTIEEYAPTLLLDELDTFLNQDRELLGVVNGSQRRSGANVLRCVGDDHEVVSFATFCPKVLVGIGGLPDTATDRSIIIRLERRGKGDPIINWRNRDHGVFTRLRSQIARWAADNIDTILVKRQHIHFPPGLDDRGQDSWEALLAIADVAGADWPSRARAACVHLLPDHTEKASLRELLLADLKVIFEASGNPQHLETAHLLDELNSRDDRPWCELNKGKALTPWGLAKYLKPFGVKPKVIRTQGRTPRGYDRGALRLAWNRYLPQQGGEISATPKQTAENCGFQADSKVQHENECCGYENTENPQKTANCGGVADSLPPSRENTGWRTEL